MFYCMTPLRELRKGCGCFAAGALRWEHVTEIFGLLADYDISEESAFSLTGFVDLTQLEGCFTTLASVFFVYSG